MILKDSDNDSPSIAAFVARAAVVAAGYYLAGKSGLLPAMSPGYATAVWPACGVALSAFAQADSSTFTVNLPATLPTASPLPAITADS